MPRDKEHIPILEGNRLDEFHFGNVPKQFSSRNHLFHINRLEDARANLSLPLPPHRKMVYDLIFITRGQSTRSKGLTEYRFGKNQFFFLPALQLTTHETMSENVLGYFMHFSPDLFTQTLQHFNTYSFLEFNAPPVVTIPEQDVYVFQNILERLLVIYQRKEAFKPDVVEWYLMALFTEVERFVDRREAPKRDTAADLTGRYKDKLTQNIYVHHSVKEYARLLYVTPNHLNKCVKKTLNQTAQSLLNDMLILEAKSLLKYSDLSISAIAEKLLGGSPSNFSRFFKRQTGKTPRDYIRQ